MSPATAGSKINMSIFVNSVFFIIFTYVVSVCDVKNEVPVTSHKSMPSALCTRRSKAGNFETILPPRRRKTLHL